MRAALLVVFVASLAAGSHLSAGRALATPPTTTSLWFYSVPPTWVVNQQLTLQVIISPYPDAGSIELKVDGATYDTQSAAGVPWVFFSFTPDTKKTYTFQAFYSGSPNFAPSQTGVESTTVVPPYPNAPTVTGTPNPVVRNDDIALTATVTPIPGPGNIEWRNSANELIGTTAVGDDGKSTLTTSFDTPGDQWIGARWMGNDDYSPRSSDSYHVTVLGDGITVAVSVPGEPVPPGDVQAEVTLTPNPGSGVLDWKLCQFCSESEVAADADGTTTLDLGTLSVGTYTLYVRYPANGTWGESTGQTEFGVWNTTSTTLTTDRTTAYVGELPVRLTATVNDLDTYGYGSVTFLDDVAGNVVELGPFPINTYTHDATYSSNALRVGTHSITARYSGTDPYLGSTSTPVIVVVGADGAVHATFSASLSKFYPAKDGFKDTVKFGGTLSERATVTIKVFNSAGTLRRTWSLGWRNPGAYSASWNGKTAGGSALPAGTYTVKAYFKDSLGHARTLATKTVISWRQVAWRSVSVLKYANVGTYYVGDFGGAIYYSPDYPKGRILDSGEMVRDCVDCGFAAGHIYFTVVSTGALGYRHLYIEIKGHDFTDREHPGSHGLIDPRTGNLALINANYPYDDPDVHWGIPFTSAYINSTHHVHAWIWMTQAWGDAYDLNWMRLTYQYAVWK